MEINEILKNVIMENEVIAESNNYMNDEEEHDRLSDCDRVEIALEMLYGVKNNYPGLASTIIRLEELCDLVEENSDEEYEDSEDDEMYEDEDEEEMMAPNPSLQNFTLSLRK
jgi:ABC-type uncharacterized transport system fused permease/ATPase subunit